MDIIFFSLSKSHILGNEEDLIIFLMYERV